MGERFARILTGAVALVLFSAAVYFGIEVTNGALKPAYYLTATFDTAGQGLESKSDVKVHGMNVGTVKKVTLINGRAQVRLEITKSQKIPVGVRASIQTKTLFGEKFVDLDPGTPQQEARGPFMRNGQRITNTQGGFELEQVLGALYPILKDVHPEDLTVILDTLANGGQGEGPAINRQLINWKTLSDIGVAHNQDTAEFFDDFALLTDTLANHSGDVVSIAQSLNSALPPLNQRGDEVASVLQNLSRVSNDFADVLDANRPFQDKAVTEGGQTLDVLSSHVGQIGPLLVGVGQYLEAQAIVGHIPYTDGSYLAAVKLIAGGGATCGQGQACTSTSPPSSTQSPLTSTSRSAPGSSPVGLAQLPQMQTGSSGINSLIQGLL